MQAKKNKSKTNASSKYFYDAIAHKFKSKVENRVANVQIVRKKIIWLLSLRIKLTAFGSLITHTIAALEQDLKLTGMQVLKFLPAWTRIHVI